MNLARNSAGISAGKPAKKPAGRTPWRWLGFALIAFALLVLLLIVAGAWVWTSESGLRFALATAERLSAGRLQLEAPSGTLSGQLRFARLYWRGADSEYEARDVRLAWQPGDLTRGRLSVDRLDIGSLRVGRVADDSQSPPPASLRLPFSLEVKALTVGEVFVDEIPALPQASPPGSLPPASPVSPVSPALPPQSSAPPAGPGDSSAGEAVPPSTVRPSSASTTPLLDSLSASLISENGQHRVSDLRVRAFGVQLSGEGRIAADSPFPLSASAQAHGEAAGRPVRLDLDVGGTLLAIQLDGRLQALSEPQPDGSAPAEANGRLQARIAPFEPQPLLSATASFPHIDPADWAAGAPQAKLSLKLDWNGQGAQAGGQLEVQNRDPGRLDQQRLPLESLQSRLRLQEKTLLFDAVDLRLAGGGSLKGSGRAEGGGGSLALKALGVDAAALHRSLAKTSLAGPLRATFSASEQRLDADLRDPRFALAARVQRDERELRLETLSLSSGDAQLQAEGRLALGGTGAFTAQGRLRNFDPARFVKLPAGLPKALLNTSLEAQGNLQPQLALSLEFRSNNSRLAGQPLRLQGSVDLAGAHVRRADVDIDAAGNHARLKGAFGAPGEALTLDIAAPRLDPLGIAGDLQGRLRLAGSANDPEFDGELKSSRLSLPGVLALKGLAFNGRVGRGRDGELSGRLRAESVTLAGSEQAFQTLALDLSGQRSRHRLGAQVQLSGLRELRLILEGGATQGGVATRPGKRPSTARDGAWVWDGRLTELRLLRTLPASSQVLLRLAAPAPLRLAGDEFALGPAELGADDWSLRIEHLRRKQGRLETAGRLQHLPPLAVLAAFPELLGEDATRSSALRTAADSLRLGGEWSLTLADRLNGHARLWRESGDLVPAGIALGLSEGRLDLRAEAGRIEAALALRGRRLGEVDGRLEAKAGSSQLLDLQAPWQGRVRVDVPDLAWAGPLAGEGIQLAGGLSGTLVLSGTPARPGYKGNWRGESLAVRALDQGMRLERGELLLELDGDLLRLRKLAFDSEFAPLPRVLRLDERLDVAALTGRPGRLEASGELRFGTVGEESGHLDFRLDRVGVMQQPDQWVAVSGEGRAVLGRGGLDLVGQLRVDAGLWVLAQSGAPRLSSDIVIKQPQGGKKGASRRPLVPGIDLRADLGRSFHFRGAGLESRLTGVLRVRADGGEQPRASGSIATEGGRFDAYGQKLEIERGILNFQGLLDNPGLNVRAMRRNLPVEAGVEVTGTVKRPIVRLVSDPNVPDTEKLSWLVLGQSPDQQGGADTTLLMTAAEAIFGGQDEGALKRLQRNLGIDEFGISSGTVSGGGRRQTSRVASSTGFGRNQALTGQIVSVGKRLSSKALLSYEQSLSTTESIVKLTMSLSRRWSLVGRAGSDTALDLYWNYSFGR